MAITPKRRRLCSRRVETRLSRLFEARVFSSVSGQAVGDRESAQDQANCSKQGKVSVPAGRYVRVTQHWHSGSNSPAGGALPGERLSEGHASWHLRHARYLDACRRRKEHETWELVTSMIALARLIKLAVCLGFLSQATSISARASSFEDEVWNAGNIDGLPPEVRSALTRMCGADVAAQRYFAGYYGSSEFLVLHFGRLRCGDRHAICSQGRCLHQVYAKEGDRYHLVKSYYGPDD
jgi:hypothetical protein